MLNFIKAELKYTKGVIRLRKSKNDRQHNGGQTKKDQQQSTKHYTENKRSSNTNPIKNSDAPKWLAIPAPLMTPVVLLLNDTNII